MTPTREPGPDDDVVERILRSLHDGDGEARFDHGYLAQIVEALSQPPGAAELALEDEMVSAAAATLGPSPRRWAAPTAPSPPPRRPAGRRVAVAAAAAAVGCLVSGSLALAGALPDGVQRPLAHALSRVGITIPAPAVAHPRVTARSGGDGQGVRPGRGCPDRPCPSRRAHTPTSTAGLQQVPAAPAPGALGGATPTAPTAPTAPGAPGTHPELPNLSRPPGQPLPVPSSIVPRQADPVQRILTDPTLPDDLGAAHKAVPR
jgi:hypothetical protein